MHVIQGYIKSWLNDIEQIEEIYHSFKEKKASEENLHWGTDEEDNVTISSLKLEFTFDAFLTCEISRHIVQKRCDSRHKERALYFH